MFDLTPEAFARSVSQSNGEAEDSAGTAAGYRAGIGLWKVTGLAASGRGLMLETFATALSLVDEKTPDSLLRSENLFEDVAQQARRFPPRLCCALLLPALGKVPGKFASLEARRRAAVVAIDVERFRLSHTGKLPEHLEEVSSTFPARIPADPFDGKPLRFRHLTKGYVIYSVGGNRQDDGGKERVSGKAGKDYDETFVVER